MVIISTSYSQTKKTIGFLVSLPWFYFVMYGLRSCLKAILNFHIAVKREILILPASIY
jgi:hypothetical protein